MCTFFESECPSDEQKIPANKISFKEKQKVGKNTVVLLESKTRQRMGNPLSCIIQS